MSLGFVRVTRNGGGGGARPVARPTFTTGRRRSAPITRTVARTVSRAIPRSVTGSPVPAGPPTTGLRPGTPDVISYYDPSRVVDLERLKVVKDLREPATAPEFAEERGDVTSGDNGATGPGSTSGTFPTRAQPTTAPGLGKQGTALALAALAALLLLRGG